MILQGIALIWNAGGLIAGPDLAFSIPEIEGYPSAQPYSAVQQLMQDEMQDAVNASAGEHGTPHVQGKDRALHQKTLRCQQLPCMLSGDG